MSGPTPEEARKARDALDAEILAWMREPVWREDEPRFERLALALFRHQVETCPAYGRFCAGRGATPAQVQRWTEIPAVPTGAFKELALRGFPAERTVKTFRTSGTTGTSGITSGGQGSEARGELHLDTLALYEASLVASFERGVLPELVGREGRARLLVLAPSAEEAPDSSLSHMFEVMRSRRGDAASGFFLRGERLEVDVLLRALETSAEAREPVALCGTAFAFVHLLEVLAERERRVALGPDVRVMETGGFKGRARERPREALYAGIQARLGVPPARVVNQYGMTELGSQFYDAVLAPVAPRPGDEREPKGDAPRRKVAPPWTRVQVVDPATGAPRPAGEPGLLRILDLANTGSVAAVETADLGRLLGPAHADGFEVLGRAPGAETRGCSVAADEMLGG